MNEKPTSNDKTVPSSDSNQAQLNTPQTATEPVFEPNPDINTKDITSDQIAKMKSEAIEYAKSYAKKGFSTRKEPSPDLPNDQGPYSWWENQATFESNTWSISLWEYDSGAWQLQATKVELQQDGRSRMTAYSMRTDTDPKFPGFQVYQEQNDERYRPAEIEDIVYLNRVLRDLKDLPKS